MNAKFLEIKAIAPSVIYMAGANEVIPCPKNTDTASMVFVEKNGVTVGFTSLSDEERIAVEKLLPTEVLFTAPVRAPDFLVSSPTPKSDALEALNEAVAEGKKGKKSIAAMVLNLAVYLLEAEKKIKIKVK